MAVREILIPYAPREAFAPFHYRAERFACIVAHRRAGKTVAAVNDLIKAALSCDKPNPRFAYVAPWYAQAKDVAWNYLKHYTAPIPGVQHNESELRVDLPNGGRVRLYGADNYDRLRGIYLDGVVLDEFADMDPRAWSEVIRPALADRQGWAAFIGTPKGKNAFYEVFERSAESDDWFSLRLKASETGIVPAHELAALKVEMSANEYEREMEASFDAAIEGAYYADAMKQALDEGRITRLTADPLMTYRAVWDIGGTGVKSDATSIWIVQYVGREIWVLDYYESQGQPLAVDVAWLRGNGYGNAFCILPHDGKTNDRVHDVSYESALKQSGFETVSIPNQGTGAYMMRIEAARRLFPRIWFDEQKTKAGRSALLSYHEKRDAKRNVGLGADHDWASHAADAFGLACVAYQEPGKRRRPESKPIMRHYNPASANSWMGS